MAVEAAGAGINALEPQRRMHAAQGQGRDQPGGGLAVDEAAGRQQEGEEETERYGHAGVGSAPIRRLLRDRLGLFRASLVLPREISSRVGENCFGWRRTAILALELA